MSVTLLSMFPDASDFLIHVPRYVSECCLHAVMYRPSGFDPAGVPPVTGRHKDQWTLLITPLATDQALTSSSKESTAKFKGERRSVIAGVSHWVLRPVNQYGSIRAFSLLESVNSC